MVLVHSLVRFFLAGKRECHLPLLCGLESLESLEKYNNSQQIIPIVEELVDELLAKVKFVTSLVLTLF